MIGFGKPFPGVCLMGLEITEASRNAVEALVPPALALALEVAAGVVRNGLGRDTELALCVLAQPILTSTMGDQTSSRKAAEVLVPLTLDLAL